MMVDRSPEARDVLTEQSILNVSKSSEDEPYLRRSRFFNIGCWIFVI
jgi:hypothetical protein